jgi:hypothetical protein
MLNGKPRNTSTDLCDQCNSKPPLHPTTWKPVWQGANVVSVISAGFHAFYQSTVVYVFLHTINKNVFGLPA